MRTDFISPESVLHQIEQIILSQSPSPLSRKRKRAFHRLMSGLSRSRSRGDRLRFMTLTSSSESEHGSLSRHFQVLRKRIERRFGFLPQYWKINTNEGHGVMHIVFKGGFIPQAWLSEAWASIHGACVVDIRALKNRPKRLANYLISNYLGKQSFERMSWSWNWVFRGFCHLWRSRFASWYCIDRVSCLRAWNRLISRYESPVPFVQGCLGG